MDCLSRNLRYLPILYDNEEYLLRAQDGMDLEVFGNHSL